jgi:uncharacterized membrane protein
MDKHANKLLRLGVTPKLPEPVNPALIKHAEERAALLTMIVSLEAIFLSTFVMISQNRADAKRQVIADQQWTTVQEEDGQNRELLDLSHQILDLAKAVHAYASAGHDVNTTNTTRRAS